MIAQEKDISLIMNGFNSYHEHITFTIKRMKDNSISFLDLSIVIKNNIIILDWFHKKTVSGRLLSFYSYYPTSQKIGTIIDLINRAILLSHPRYHSTNIVKCINIDEMDILYLWCLITLIKSLGG